MLFYHPFLDPYHCSFRILRLLRALGEAKVEIDRFRAFDFYLLFPHSLLSARLPQKDSKRMRKILLRYEDSYELLPDHRRMFLRLAPIQDAAIQYLAGRKLLDNDALLNSHIKVGLAVQDTLLTEKILERNAADNDLIAFLTESFLTIPFFGVGGIRSRTDLFDDRYDII